MEAAQKHRLAAWIPWDTDKIHLVCAPPFSFTRALPHSFRKTLQTQQRAMYWLGSSSSDRWIYTHHVNELRDQCCHWVMGAPGCWTESARCHAQLPHECPVTRQTLGRIFAPSIRSIPLWHKHEPAFHKSSSGEDFRYLHHCCNFSAYLRSKTHSLDQCWMQSVPIHLLFLSPIFVFILISATTRKSVRYRHDIMKLQSFLHPWRHSQQCANAKKDETLGKPVDASAQVMTYALKV